MKIKYREASLDPLRISIFRTLAVMTSALKQQSATGFETFGKEVNIVNVIF